MQIEIFIFILSLVALHFIFQAGQQRLRDSFLFFKSFSMKYNISLSEFIPNGKRNYYQHRFPANT
ncbi:MAG: hypothetical protein OQJ93_12325, partial [Ignavibacteriaceae bacterium]|nr:hypothetical protein [Ignavibacteriaceae bacterium]